MTTTAATAKAAEAAAESRRAAETSGVPPQYTTLPRPPTPPAPLPPVAIPPGYVLVSDQPVGYVHRSDGTDVPVGPATGQVRYIVMRRGTELEGEISGRLVVSQGRTLVMHCPHCNKQVNTVVRQKPSTTAWLAAGALFLVGAWPIAWVPLVMNALKDKHHKCSSCHTKLLVIPFDKGTGPFSRIH
ncbi:hypothetical protein M427DRAFT_468236 [Gonapodya prolifera JEL478]|uniref:LITAF domain-containing protein n=1 Tax=Gonapodya prolifera (strain JEL478) TaxID=1344416 RepID=A0A139A1P9_GONPJ|nr:hypothetical protein M427DRAFT_468236 [Gonapodya prolifera JEL478]|eukprot:KXS10664.1 hypothetical protein M427DRAFT_468236 [Gonapodya prolifera JEL478]